MAVCYRPAELQCSTCQACPFAELGLSGRQPSAHAVGVCMMAPHMQAGSQPDSLPASLQEWAQPGGAVVPMQCVMDLLGNAYNVTNPAALDFCTRCVVPNIQDSRLGPSMDLDALLQVLLDDLESGELLPALLVTAAHQIRLGAIPDHLKSPLLKDLEPCEQG